MVLAVKPIRLRQFSVPSVFGIISVKTNIKTLDSMFWSFEKTYEDMQKLMHQYTDPKMKAAKVRDVYGNTYWYYYFFVK